MKEKFSLKDYMFNPKKVSYIAGLIKAVYPVFEDKRFQKNVLSRFPELELKERITWIRENLKAELPVGYTEALQVLLKALPKPCDPTKTDDDFGQFILSPFSEFVAIYGCSEVHLKISLNALREMTKRFSSEFAIRYFINAFPEETMKEIEKWPKDAHYHVRRLASEGTRPRLPWAQNVHLNQKEVVSKILDQLYFDQTRFVVRSVANHMNDISKVNPTLVVKTLKRWKASGKQVVGEMDYLISHSLRTLVKKGDEAALELLGYHKHPKIKVGSFKIDTPTVKISEALVFSFDLKLEKAESLVIDYRLHFMNKSGRLNPKVFKIKKGRFKKDEVLKVIKKHPLRVMTTKKLYTGIHRVELQINGDAYGHAEFELVDK